MSLISLQNSSELGVTILSNRFIDNFMPRANGEFVKVYIYLLRMVSATPSSFSLEHMADSLFCTERDISRALKYWEGEKLIALAYTADQKLSGITLLEPFADTGHRESSASMDTFTGSGNSSSVSGNTDPEVPSSADYILSLTPDRIRELKQNEEISQLLYITEQYLTKTLTPTEMQKILFSMMSSICLRISSNIWWNTVFPEAARVCVILKLLHSPGQKTASPPSRWHGMPAPVFPRIITRS